MFTPWGTSDSSTPYFDGVTFYSTPRHGGFKVSKKRLAEMPPCLRNENGWYEEDCEALKVFMAFPTEFFKTGKLNRDSYAKSKQSFMGWFPDEYAVLFGRMPTAAESHVVADREFAARTHDKFVVTSAWGSWQNGVPDGMVGVSATKASTGDHKYFLVPEALYQTRKSHFCIDDYPNAGIVETTDFTGNGRRTKAL